MFCGILQKITEAIYCALMLRALLQRERREANPGSLIWVLLRLVEYFTVVQSWMLNQQHKRWHSILFKVWGLQTLTLLYINSTFAPFSITSNDILFFSRSMTHKTLVLYLFNTLMPRFAPNFMQGMAGPLVVP
jgi:hypothetical protein